VVVRQCQFLRKKTPLRVESGVLFFVVYLAQMVPDLLALYNSDVLVTD